MRDIGFDFIYCLNLCSFNFSDILSKDNVEDLNKRFRHPSSHIRSRLTNFDGRVRQLHEVSQLGRRDPGKDLSRNITNNPDTEDNSDASSSDSLWRVATLGRKKEKWVLQNNKEIMPAKEQ